MEKDFGTKIKEAREHKKITQEDAATEIRNSYGVRLSSAYLSMIERGERTNLTTKLEKAIRGFYGMDEVEVLEKKPKDLQKILEQHEIMFSGTPLTDADKQAILDVVELQLYKRAKELNKRKKTSP
jgi:transcriptional regulator with XRE-family HTH domain